VALKQGLALLAALTTLHAQESPRANRVAWLEILPEPLPDGSLSIALEATSQFLRPDFERSGDGRTFARLDGEEWQMTVDLPMKLGPGFLNLRIRVLDRSGGFLDQLFVSWHSFLGVTQGGRDQVPKYRLDYELVRDGVVVARLLHPKTQVMPFDLTWQVPWGTPTLGGRIGLGVQASGGLPRDNFNALGGTNALLGGSAWKAWGRIRVHGQLERVFIGLPADSPYRSVMERRQVSRAWLGFGWQGDGPGLLGGLGLDVAVGYQGSPYHVGIVRIDRAGWQQHWTFSHRKFPNWRFSFSEEAGTYTAPDITGALIYRFPGPRAVN
jgi:hypothetical protein